MNVVLIGYRGTGKSTVARELAPLLGHEVISLDEQIVRRAGQPIPAIVADRGWDGFRDLEEEVCRICAAGDGRILDCGGGVVERAPNAPVLRASGPVFWLTASVEAIVRRIQGDDQRPSLTGSQSFTQEVSEVLARRIPLYRALANFEVATDGRSPSEIAAEIVAHLRRESPA